MAGTETIVALAALAGAGASVYSATKKPDLPKPPSLPDAPEVKVADTGALEGQRRRRAAVAGRQGTMLTGGLGGAGTLPNTKLGV